jgi:beta-glucosidase
MVLLKNEEGILPLNAKSIDSIALFGPNLKKKYGRILSGGSSAVVPPHEITPLDGMREKCRNLINIVSDPSQADVAIVFAGLGHGRGQDSESSDRKLLKLPENQVELIKRTTEVNRNTIVVLMAGSPIAMSDWLSSVPAVLMAWYPGMEGGRAIANVLFGYVNPSGRLPITFPKKLSDSPAHSGGTPRTFPGTDKKVYYDEGVFVGYRWFDEKDIEPLFPFGFGQSYTSFEYSDIHLSQESIRSPEDALQVELKVANVGEYTGSEVVQVYSSDVKSSVPRPPKELVGFEKVLLGPGEERIVVVNVSAQDLAFYSISRHDWLIEPGAFEILVGRSVQDVDTRLDFRYG